MTRRPNLILAVALAAALTLGSVQGARVNHLRESDRFYRWLVSAVIQMRVQGALEPIAVGSGAIDAKDEELYESIKEVAERYLPDLPATDTEAPLSSKLERYAVPPEAKTLVPGDVALFLPDPKEQQRRLKLLWAFARSSEIAEQRANFLRYLQDKQLVSVGSQFDINQLYGSQDITVSLSNLIFGFRKMAANLLWLRADKYWHAGQYYRMVPIMKTTVALDPSFIDAYLIGAWHMAYNATYDLPDTPIQLRRYDRRYGERVGEKEAFYYEAINFLKDGIRKNPTSYKLYFDLGFSIYNEKLNDQANAVKYLTEAYRQPHDIWVPRMLYRCMIKNKQYEEALAGYEHYMEHYVRHPEGETREADKISRFITLCKGLVHKKKAEEARAKKEEARHAAVQARHSAEEAREAGNETLAQQEEARAIEQDKVAEAFREEANQHWERARASWQEVLETAPDDVFAQASLMKMQAIELADQGRYVEARALLDHARFTCDELFYELSDLIIDIKFAEGAPLNLSEKKAVARRHLEEAVRDRTLGDRTFKFRDDGWYQENYRDQETVVLSEDSPKLRELAAQEPRLDEILGLARLNEAYPDLNDIIDLGNRVVFQVDGQWYAYLAAGPAQPGANA